MLSHLFYFSMAIGFILAGDDNGGGDNPNPPTVPVDNTCIVDGKFTEEAFLCENTENEVFCSATFGPADVKKALKVGSPVADRPAKCYGASEDIRKGAISTCAKSCGYCCKSPAYNCEDKKGGPLVCADVTRAMCKDPLWKDQLIANCPSKCGFCAEVPKDGCVDLAVDCGKDMTKCRSTVYLTFMMTNCKKTCGYCDLKPPTPTKAVVVQKNVPAAGCFDLSRHCGAWKNKGFCSSTWYSLENKKHFCIATCGLC